MSARRGAPCRSGAPAAMAHAINQSAAPVPTNPCRSGASPRLQRKTTAASHQAPNRPGGWPPTRNRRALRPRRSGAPAAIPRLIHTGASTILSARGLASHTRSSGAHPWSGASPRLHPKTTAAPHQTPNRPGGWPPTKDPRALRLCRSGAPAAVERAIGLSAGLLQQMPLICSCMQGAQERTRP